MCVHVERQVVDLMKRFVADSTFELLLGGMRQLMVLVVALLMEAFATDFTVPRLVILVYAHVRVQCGRAVKRLTTDAALVWLF